MSGGSALPRRDAMTDWLRSAGAVRTRARDLDRSEVCGLLDAAYADGQLDAEEHRSRTAAATPAKTLGELREFVDDLQLEKPLPDLRERAPQRPAHLRAASWPPLPRWCCSAPGSGSGA